MPQMMPINWIVLFILFMLFFMLFNMMNYYIFIFNKKSSFLPKMKIKNFLWKW
uniref:ATP synthase F0 subunit 8 n=1 Tax=Coptotriche turpinia TaxID=2984363 RepID=UPI0022376331|nr:ATP synthase F0 subunit 8 [Coptotriche turpinia]UYB79006.1 ATP synthase F0 subunit 8 [Coptotriche turpinia]